MPANCKLQHQNELPSFFGWPLTLSTLQLPPILPIQQTCLNSSVHERLVGGRPQAISPLLYRPIHSPYCCSPALPACLCEHMQWVSNFALAGTKPDKLHGALRESDLPWITFSQASEDGRHPMATILSQTAIAAVIFPACTASRRRSSSI